MKEAGMHRRALGMAVRAGTLGALAAAVGVVSPAAAVPGHPAAVAGRTGAGDAVPGPIAAPASPVLLINGDRGLVSHAAGGSVVETITGAYRTAGPRM
jgi:hypothetical protein